jgi:hypothetical protein
MDAQRFANRDKLFRKLVDNSPNREVMSDYQQQSMLRSMDNAYRLLSSKEREAFDITLEDKATLAKYDTGRFGRGCLLARRLVEAGARFVEAMACARVPKIVLTVNHASGAGYYAMAGQGFDPDFILSWPTGRMAVMEGEAAVQAVHGPTFEKAKKAGVQPSPAVLASADEMRADYEQQYTVSIAVRDTISAINDWLARIRQLPEAERSQFSEFERALTPVAAPGESVAPARLLTHYGVLYGTLVTDGGYGTGSAEGRPSDGVLARQADLDAQWAELRRRLDAAWGRR